MKAVPRRVASAPLLFVIPGAEMTDSVSWCDVSEWSGAQCAGWLKSLPPELQRQLAAHLPETKPPMPHTVAAGSVDDLLLECGEQILPYKPTFAEYELQRASQLSSLGPAGLEELLSELGVTRDHRDKIVALALSERPMGASGGCFDPRFLRVARPLHTQHMGCENMAPLLYALARFTKPRRVLEVGAGYTSLWLLQALADNAAELARCARAEERDGGGAQCDGGGYQVAGVPWLVDGWAPPPHGVLHCVDDLSHKHTTAHRVQAAADELGIAHHLKLHVCDAYELATTFGEDGGEDDDGLLDLLWLDFGAGVGGRLAAFLGAWWPRVRPGGLLLLHSTCTNALTRAWLENMRARQRGEEPQGPAVDNPLGDEFVELSFFEPHKRFQNSTSLFQRRPSGWAGEPVHTMYP